MLKINEVFYSIQGESSWVGHPTVFVRTTGCNLRCTYCDTKYSYYEGDFRETEQLMNQIRQHKTRYVCITGGEPLLQKAILPFMDQLVSQNYLVSLETSGSKSIESVNPNVKVILDVKTPDSGAAESFLFSNLKHINPLTEFKFVICSEKDFEWSEEFCRQHELFGKFTILYSPSYGEVSERWLAERILAKNSIARMQIQLHKKIWSPDARGV
ncbi:MAG: radical SAM protein [Bdellovibrionaceae bacterium]|nr:radical SAM protein [Pseudobdellovibrionaceae bacterium]